MKTEEITFICKGKGKEVVKGIKRQEFYDLMKSIKNAFSKENEISTKLVELTPSLISITVNAERNEHLDVPCIYCECEEGNVQIEIMRRHKIIWSILNKYCE